MKMNYVLVDFENVQPANLGALRGGLFKIKIFVGLAQKIPVDVAKALQAFGPDAEYIQIEGNGKNALDFHIAYYIGRLVAEPSNVHFYIVSKDTGFDPLIQHLKRQKITCERVPSVAHILPTKKELDTISVSEKAESVIVRLNKGTKPRTEKALRTTIKGLFANQLNDEQITAIIRELQRRKAVSISDGKVTYCLSS